MPRRTRSRKSRRTPTAIPEPDMTPDQLARDLVKRGLASPAVLGPGRHPWTERGGER